MPLRDSGWMAEQAQGLFESLNLDGGTPKWKREHLQRLRSWCSAHGKDSATVDGQLEFVAADICDTYEGVGMALKRATTVTEATVAVAPYVNRLAASDTRTLVNTFEVGESGGAGVRRRA
jgi:Phage tail lysozyme